MSRPKRACEKIHDSVNHIAVESVNRRVMMIGGIAGLSSINSPQMLREHGFGAVVAGQIAHGDSCMFPIRGAIYRRRSKCFGLLPQFFL